MRDAHHIRIAELNARVDELEEENRQLRELAAPEFRYPAEMKLTPTEGQVLAVIAARSGPTSAGRINNILYAVAGIDVQDKTIDVFICKIRRKLKPFGIEIRNVWGHGFELTQENKNRLNGVVSRCRRRAPLGDQLSAGPA